MTLLAERPSTPLELRRFTFAEFAQMSDLGMFADQHVELLNGELTVKGKQSPQHAYVIQRLSAWFYAHLTEQACIRVQLPLVLISPPPDFVEPDLALLNLPAEQYATRDADSSDALLLIEVSDSTLDRDRTEKLAAYARNGIPEYWVYHVQTNKLEVFTEPFENVYTQTNVYLVGKPVSVMGFQLVWWA